VTNNIKPTYRLIQESKPLPNYQEIVLNRTEVRQRD